MHNKKSYDDYSSGIRIARLNNIFIIVMAIFCILIFSLTYRINNNFNKMVTSITDYADCNKAINELKGASDYLTNQVMYFVVRQDIDYMNNYFTEFNGWKRRENSVDIVRMSHSEDETDNLLSKALDESNDLAKIDFYAMKLVCDALKVSNLLIPAEIQDCELNDSDVQLNANQKIAMAQSIIFGEEYLNYKKKIEYYTSSATIGLIEEYISEYKNSQDNLKFSMTIQATLLGLMFVTFFGIIILIRNNVFEPLRNYVKCIENDSKMIPQGSYETKYISYAYNKLIHRTATNLAILRHKAEHDTLTGVINREGLNTILDALAQLDEPIAYLIVDIDLFKQINDNYGHIVGDGVLQNVANILMEQFRSTDYVARTGGDEFVIIMTKCGVSPMDIIMRKINNINTVLQNSYNNLPPVSLSVGVAFNDNGYTPELVKRADEALYRVKRGGRCNCAFYTQIDEV